MQKYSANFFQSKQQKPRKSSLLPYPLPDVYGTEVYDPHGLFQAKVKTETTEIELSGDSNDLDTTQNPISALATKLNQAFITEQPPQPNSPRLASLSRLRIGSSATTVPNPIAPLEENQNQNHSPIPIPIPSSPVSLLRGRSNSVMRMEEEEDSRSRGSSPYGDIAWSPAMGFLSSFGDTGPTSNTEHEIIAGDAEGFEVCGYILGKELGTGAFGVVREAIKLDGDKTGQRVAVKIVKHAVPVMEKTKEEKDQLRRSLSGIRMGSRRVSMANESRSRSSSGSGSAVIFRRGFQDLSNSFSSLPPPFPTSPTSFTGELPSTLPSTAPYESLLEREISLWQNLPPHPHIVPLLDVHHNFDYSYIFMPLCEGGNLLTYLNDFHKTKSTISTPTRGRAGRKSLESSFMGLTELEEGVNEESRGRKGLPFTKCLPIFAQIVSGLHHLHTIAHITHKDIKLENILCDEKGVGGSWKIADFGLAETGVPSSTPSPTETEFKRRDTSLGGEENYRSHRQFTSEAGPSRPNQNSSCLGRSSSLSVKAIATTVTEHESPAGSLPYSAPEVVSPRIGQSGTASQAVDIWALGCVLYAMIEGKLPFEDNFEPRLRMKILGGKWDIPELLLPNVKLSLTTMSSEGIRSSELEKSQILELLENTLQVDVSKRWNIETIRTSPWVLSSISSRSVSRGRAARRPPPTLLSFTDAKEIPAAERSPSEYRRKERSTSRGPSTHYGIDPRTKSLERKEVKKWSGKTESVGGRISSRSASRSREATREVGKDSGERLGRGTEPY